MQHSNVMTAGATTRYALHLSPPQAMKQPTDRQHQCGGSGIKRMAMPNNSLSTFVFPEILSGEAQGMGSQLTSPS